jgi:hypothetical protein
MVSEAVGFIGILLLAAAIIIGIYFWITVRLNGQTPDEYLNEFLDSLNEKNRTHWRKSTLFELSAKEVFTDYSISLQGRAKFIYQPPVEFYDKPASSKNE